MKKIVLSLAAAMLLCVPAIFGQVKVDVANYKNRIAKSDDDIANPKKNAKASTWLDRGNTFYEVASAPTAGAFAGMDEKAAEVLFGKPAIGSQTIGETEYKTETFSNLKGYFTKSGEVYKLQFWTTDIVITDDPLGKSFEAYMKAYALDPGSASKVVIGQKQLGDAYKQAASNAFSLQKYADAAVNFEGAFNVQIAPPCNVVDTASVFNAGYLYTAAENYVKGAENLEKALKYGFGGDGDAYYYLYYCYNKTNQPAAKIKAMLLSGMEKYPTNSKIVEGLLSFYTQSGEDPKDIIPIVQKAIANDPKNPTLYSGLGLVYDKLGEMDKAIEAFTQSAALTPDDYNSNFNLGLLIVKSGDKMNTEFNKNPPVSDADYNAGLKAINNVYAKAIPALEKALSLKPGDAGCIELLSNLTRRLKDSPGMAEKSEKYKAMYDALPKE